ncbi:alpha/beta fold hydrolase [Asanoa sp. NPDC050611]|uniref:alpha/beta fold hydrolase n=1 Tax=Asanoa sp. NPDC050611 TaxID=3157098 RepID=UPI0033C1124F
MTISVFTSPKARTTFQTLYASAFARLWPVPYTEVMLPTSYGVTRVYRSGPPSGIPFVLLPGAGGNSLMWHRHVAALAADRPVIAVDTIGEPGGSVQDRPIGGGDDLVAWLGEVLSTLDIPRAHLVGCSYGGWIALRSADRASSISLLDPAGLGRVTPGFLAWVIAGGLAALLPAGVRHRLAGVLHNATLRDDELMPLLRASMGFRRRLPVPPPLTDEALRALAGVPLLVLLGARSQLYDANTVATRLRTLLPAARVEVVPGASHDLPVHSPDLVVDRIRTFTAS